MGEILSIRGEPLEQKGTEPDEKVISILEEFLAQAKRGDLAAVAVIGVAHGGTLMPRMHTVGTSCFGLLAGMEFLRTQIVRLMELNSR